MHPWQRASFGAPAAELHALALPAQGRHVWHLEADAPALVLGSTQPASDVDEQRCAAAGVAVARRRSGGGAVLVGPGECLWIDVLVPRGDPLWHDDIGRAAWWLGEAWRRALGVCGITDLDVHRGALVRTRWSSVVCFAGLGPGEVVDRSGAKLVGISQRRTRGMARFQCAVPLRWDPAQLSALLTARPPASELGPVATIDAAPGALVDAFVGCLPTD
jgi:lipoate-protein ligase A